MIPEVAWETVPPNYPDDGEPWVILAASDSHLPERSARAYAWAHRMLRAVADLGADGPVPFFRTAPYRVADVSAGFIPMRGDGLDRSSRRYPPALFLYLGTPPLPSTIAVTDDTATEWRFGVVIGIDALPPSPGEPSPPPFDPMRVQPHTWNGPGPSVPILAEWRELREEGPPNPAGAATSACYARPRAGKRFYSGAHWSDGILIARHVLVPGGYARVGSRVPMSASGTTPVVDIDAATTIDAAILGATAAPSGLAPLAVANAVAPGVRVSVSGAVTAFSADVLRVMDDSRYFGNMVAHRAFLDAHGASGDSGALATDTGAGDAVGLYIGQHGTPAEGIVQLMRQVVSYFEVDLLN